MLACPPQHLGQKTDKLVIFPTSPPPLNITSSGSMFQGLLSELKIFKVKSHVKISKKYLTLDFEVSEKHQGWLWLPTAGLDES